MDSHMDVEEGEEDEEEKKLLTRHKAADLAMAGLRASLAVLPAVQVPLEPRVTTFIPTPPVEEEKDDGRQAAYYSQLQTRSLTHDVTKAAMKKRRARALDFLAGSPHRSLSSEQPPGPGVGTSPFRRGGRGRIV